MKRTPLKSRARQIRPSIEPGKVEVWVSEDNGENWVFEKLRDGPKSLKKGNGFSTSQRQRQKVSGEVCVIVGCEHEGTDPAHLCAKAKGGCVDDLCVIPLCRVHHELFDTRRLDLLPHLVKRHVPELQHALGHYEGNLIALLQRLTSQRWRPE